MLERKRILCDRDGEEPKKAERWRRRSTRRALAQFATSDAGRVSRSTQLHSPNPSPGASVCMSSPCLFISNAGSRNLSLGVSEVREAARSSSPDAATVVASATAGGAASASALQPELGSASIAVVGSGLAASRPASPSCEPSAWT